ncbi:MAG TPA: hypothetical protein VFJ91_06195 [Gaiellaceae bacterium]|jgi:hypothetical protein|nr:hypothetical protein [Gaiellaceae bacterium]
MADWATISALATAGGTLALAGVTLASVRSANRAARVAEQSLLAAQRPLLVTARVDDPPQKVGFQDDVWFQVAGAEAVVRATDGVIYLAFPVRNVGTGIALLHGWRLYPEFQVGRDARPTAVGDFTALTRDLYVAAGDAGFWQGSFRDPQREDTRAARAAIEARRRLNVDLLYGDLEGGQRVISRFTLTPREDNWYVSVGRHWNVDRPNPR